MHRALIHGATPADAAAHALATLPAHSDAAQPPPATTGHHSSAGTCMGTSRPLPDPRSGNPQARTTANGSVSAPVRFRTVQTC